MLSYFNFRLILRNIVTAPLVLLTVIITFPHGAFAEVGVRLKTTTTPEVVAEVDNRAENPTPPGYYRELLSNLIDEAIHAETDSIFEGLELSEGYDANQTGESSSIIVATPVAAAAAGFLAGIAADLLSNALWDWFQADSQEQFAEFQHQANEYEYMLENTQDFDAEELEEQIEDIEEAAQEFLQDFAHGGVELGERQLTESKLDY